MKFIKLEMSALPDNTLLKFLLFFLKCIKSYTDSRDHLLIDLFIKLVLFYLNFAPQRKPFKFVLQNYDLAIGLLNCFKLFTL